MIINRDTIVCISLAARPGNLGATIFNHAFEALSMNWLYKPFQVDSEELEAAIGGIRALNIRGCGVSMPHKSSVMQYLDHIDPSIQKIGAINTIVNDQGILTGYNTDCEGAAILFRRITDLAQGGALIVGAGGASRAIIQALKNNQVKDIAVTNRTDTRASALAKELDIRFIPWQERNTCQGVLLINATPVGMQEDDPELVSDILLERFSVIMDVVVSAEDTDLLARAKKKNKKVIQGREMAVLQGIVQFRLYTGKDIDPQLVEEGVKKFLNKT